MSLLRLLRKAVSENRFNPFSKKAFSAQESNMNLSADKNENDEFRKQILNEYIGKQHRDLIIACAQKHVKIAKNIQLMLMLLGKIYQNKDESITSPLKL